MKSKNIVIVLLSLCLLATSSYIATTLVMDSGKNAKDKDVAQIEQSKDDAKPQAQQPKEIVVDEIPVHNQVPKDETTPPVTAQPSDKPAMRSVNEIYNIIHRMSHNFIIAEDDFIRGIEEITKEKVEGLIAEVTSSDYVDKEKLLEILNRWKKEDFSKGDEDHNYVWAKLEGELGKAIGVKPEYRKSQTANQNN